MQKSKRHHWVPQSYLRAFAADGNTREKIWRFGKTEGNDPELKPIKNVAVEFYLYAPKDDEGRRDYSFESKLSSLENLFGHPLWSKLCNEMVDLQREPLRKMVSLLVAVMHLRNPAQFKRWKAMHQQIVGEISSLPELPTTFEIKGKVLPFDRESWPGYRDASDDDLKKEWLKEVGSAVWAAEILMKMRWAVLFTEEPVFITSDNPVTITHPSLMFRGLNNPETTLMFPLSPTRVLHMDNRHSEPDGHYYPLNADPAHTNYALWHHATEYMFSHRDPDIVSAEMVRMAEEMT